MSFCVGLWCVFHGQLTLYSAIHVDELDQGPGGNSKAGQGGARGNEFENGFDRHACLRNQAEWQSAIRGQRVESRGITAY